MLLKIRHLYRTTTSGAEEAGCAHGEHGAQTPYCTLRMCTVSRFRVIRNLYTFIEFNNQKLYRKLFREFFGIPENAQKRPKKGEFHGILKWWKIHSHAVRGLRISGFLRTPQNGPFYYKYYPSY
jgi:hypothetical protein